MLLMSRRMVSWGISSETWIRVRENERANKWHRYLCHQGTAYTLWPHVLHQEEPRAHCTSVRSDHLSEDFILVANSSQGTVGYDMEVEFQSLSDWSASVSFRSLLVKHCQAEFKKNFEREDISRKGGSCLEPVRDVRVIDRLREEKNNAKPSCRSIHTIRFIGELFLSKVLGEKAMHCCIRRLLQNGDGPSLESLCELLQLIQQDLEVVTSREVMDSYHN
ncbi:unnamed protein product [Pleuronectes platessa]|uniref:MIF4G domain-containing protein n=1 Tax=Pleuronectes platessa TaxID=8262 RepID=A0A9N7TMH7_PLEPL|nr:unnamed protein product [Pleuronectes platessa]